MTMTYDEAKQKLSDRVRLSHQTDWSPTPSRKECERVAEALERVADLLATTPESQRIESAHEARAEPETITGLDGFPVKEERDEDWISYEMMKWKIRDLAESARAAAEELPDPREKHALRHAALGLLHLRSWHGMPYATEYIDGPVNIELEQIAVHAGIILSRAAYLKALKEALSTFDRHFTPPGFHYLFK